MSSTSKFLNLSRKLTQRKPIRIKPQNKGKLHAALGVAKGKKISTSKLSAAKANAKKTGNTKLMKEVTFAQNAKKWSHK